MGFHSTGSVSRQIVHSLVEVNQAILAWAGEEVSDEGGHGGG